MPIHRRELKLSHSSVNLYYSTFRCCSNLTASLLPRYPSYVLITFLNTHIDSITPLLKIWSEAQLSHRIWNQSPFAGSPTFSLSWQRNYAPHFPFSGICQHSTQPSRTPWKITSSHKGSLIFLVGIKHVSIHTLLALVSFSEVYL